MKLPLCYLEVLRELEPTLKKHGIITYTVMGADPHFDVRCLDPKVLEDWLFEFRMRD